MSPARSFMLASLLVAKGLGQSVFSSNLVEVEERRLANDTVGDCPELLSETKVHVQGSSGKFTIYNAEEGKNSGMNIAMDELKELDSNGNAVGQSGSTKHSFNSFASQDFTIEDPVATTLPDTSINATLIRFSSDITIGKITVDTYIVRGCGKAGPTGELYDVRPGDVKWNIKLSNWDWCAPCGSGNNAETGDMIDFVISVKGKGDGKEKAGNKNTISMGGNSEIQLSTKVQKDGGAWLSMAEGYPKTEIQGKSTKFTFRFPKFASEAVYDPVVTGISPVEGDDAADTGATVSSSTRTCNGMVPLFAAFLLAVIKY